MALVDSPPASRVLVVGAGGLGAPVALALASSGAVKVLGLVDDDAVDRTNLHRQILFRDADVGRPKIEAARDALGKLVDVEMHPTRLVPETADDLVARYDVVVEGSDNFATKFLAADACARANKPIVHGAAVRWIGTALAVGAHRRPCYRCLFEDMPEGDAPSCADAGVMGPVVGVVGALQADLALAMLAGDARAPGTLVTFDGRTEKLRRTRVNARRSCALCGPPATKAKD